MFNLNFSNFNRGSLEEAIQPKSAMSAREIEPASLIDSTETGANIAVWKNARRLACLKMVRLLFILKFLKCLIEKKKGLFFYF